MLRQNGREDHSLRRARGMGDALEKKLRCGRAHLDGVLLVGREIDRAGHIVAAVIVVADDADVIGNANAVAAEGIDHSRSHQTRRREYGCEAFFGRHFGKDRSEVASALPVALDPPRAMASTASSAASSSNKAFTSSISHLL